MILGGTLLVSLATVPAASASTSVPSVIISNLTNGQTVSGAVEVDATITPTPDAPAQKVTFSIGLGVNTIEQAITLAPGQCDTTCTVSWTGNTAQVLPYRTGGSPIPETPDGSAQVNVMVQSEIGDFGATTPVTIDNHRPTLVPAAGSLTSEGTLVGKGDQTVELAVNPAVSATAPNGSTLTSVEFESPVNPELPVIDFTPSADRTTWTATVDTSSLPAALYGGAIVATDSNGVASAPLQAVLLVDHGFKLTLPGGSSVVTGPEMTIPTLNYLYPGLTSCYSGPLEAWPTRVDILLDGKSWYSTPAPGISGDLGANGCDFPASIGQPPALPFGHHTLTYVVTDSVGVQESVTQNVTVALPLNSTWPTTPMSVAVGRAVTLTPKVTAPDGFSQLKSWVIALNGTTLASGSYPTQPTLHWTTPANRTEYGQLTLTTTSDSGLTRTSGFTFSSSWETATFLSASATTVKPGTWVKLTASTWDYYLGAWRQLTTADATARDQWQYPGSSTWTNGAAVYTNPAAPGPAKIWVEVSKSTCYRVMWATNTPANSDSPYLPSTSSSICVTAKA